MKQASGGVLRACQGGRLGNQEIDSVGETSLQTPHGIMMLLTGNHVGNYLAKLVKDGELCKLVEVKMTTEHYCRLINMITWGICDGEL